MIPDAARAGSIVHYFFHRSGEPNLDTGVLHQSAQRVNDIARFSAFGEDPTIVTFVGLDAKLVEVVKYIGICELIERMFEEARFVRSELLPQRFQVSPMCDVA